MKQYILPGIVLVLIILVIGAIVKGVFFKPANAGLKVDSLPSANIFLDGKSLGKTPYEEEKLSPGEKTLKLVPEGTFANLYPWETKIKLVSGTMTVVKREFGETEGRSSGEMITLEKIADKKTATLVVVSLPDSVVVKINGESRGFTPLSLNKLSEGDEEISVSSSGFKERTVKTKLIAGYKTTVNIKLAESEEEGLTGTPTPLPSGTITPTPKLTPKPTGPTPTPPPKPYIEIKQTPTGWLRVRLEPSKTATEAAKVYPGEKYSLLDEQSGWYKIEYKKGEQGWVSGQYAEKYE
ncbi:MAG: PEGA domain-containing protein [Patescibacteria group bacterium]